MVVGYDITIGRDDYARTSRLLLALLWLTALRLLWLRKAKELEEWVIWHHQTLLTHLNLRYRLDIYHRLNGTLGCEGKVRVGCRLLHLYELCLRYWHSVAIAIYILYGCCRLRIADNYIRCYACTEECRNEAYCYQYKSVLFHNLCFYFALKNERTHKIIANNMNFQTFLTISFGGLRLFEKKYYLCELFIYLLID